MAAPARKEPPSTLNSPSKTAATVPSVRTLVTPSIRVPVVNSRALCRQPPGGVSSTFARLSGTSRARVWAACRSRPAARASSPSRSLTRSRDAASLPQPVLRVLAQSWPSLPAAPSGSTGERCLSKTLATFLANVWVTSSGTPSLYRPLEKWAWTSVRTPPRSSAKRSASWCGRPSGPVADFASGAAAWEAAVFPGRLAAAFPTSAGRGPVNTSRRDLPSVCLTPDPIWLPSHLANAIPAASSGAAMAPPMAPAAADWPTRSQSIVSRWPLSIWMAWTRSSSAVSTPAPMALCAAMAKTTRRSRARMTDRVARNRMLSMAAKAGPRK
ncbi:hypothetical protein STAL104432_11420 [Streptomyces albus]